MGTKNEFTSHDVSGMAAAILQTVNAKTQTLFTPAKHPMKIPV